jgi:hypothetical protein
MNAINKKGHNGKVLEVLEESISFSSTTEKLSD